MQLIPSPENPGLQEQLNDPLLLLQMALRLQLPVLMAHSSMSKQILKKKQISGFNLYLFSIIFIKSLIISVVHRSELFNTFYS